MLNTEIPVNKTSFSCITCRQVFSDFTEQRAHFQTAFHQENCRRKAVSLPPMTTQEYIDFLNMHAQKQQEKLKETQKNKSVKKERIMCQICQKIFSSENAYKSHAASEKHKDAIRFIIQERIEEEKKREAIALMQMRKMESALNRPEQPNNEKINGVIPKKIIIEEEMPKIKDEKKKTIFTQSTEKSKYSNPFSKTVTTIPSGNAWAALSTKKAEENEIVDANKSDTEEEEKITGFGFSDPLAKGNESEAESDETTEEENEKDMGITDNSDQIVIAEKLINQKQVNEKSTGFTPFVQPRNNSVCLTGVTQINKKTSNFVEYQQRFSNTANVAGSGKKMISTINVDKTPTTVKEGFVPSDNNIVYSTRLDGFRTSKLKRDQKLAEYTNIKGNSVRVITADEAINDFYQTYTKKTIENENENENELNIEEVIDYPPFIAANEEEIWKEILPKLMDLGTDEERDDFIYKEIIAKREIMPFRRCLFCTYESQLCLENNNNEEPNEFEEEEKEEKIFEDLMEHMRIQHSFFIPAEEYCIDKIGFCKQLQSDISQGFCCIVCDHGFKSINAAQNHMRTKGHTHVLLQGNEFLYADFYDYTKSYPEKMLKEIAEIADDDDEYEAMMKEVRALPFNYISAMEREKMQKLGVSKYAGKLLSNGRGRVIAIGEYRRLYQAVVPKWCINKYNQMVERNSALRVLAIAQKSGVDVNKLFLTQEQKEEKNMKAKEEVSIQSNKSEEKEVIHTLACDAAKPTKIEAVRESGSNAITTLLNKLKMTAKEVVNLLGLRKTQKDLCPTNEIKIQSKAVTEVKKQENMNIDKPFFKRSTLHMYY